MSLYFGRIKYFAGFPLFGARSLHEKRKKLSVISPRAGQNTEKFRISPLWRTFYGLVFPYKTRGLIRKNSVDYLLNETASP